MTYTDAELLRLYREWSEQAYAAGFEIGDEFHVQKFRRWLEWREKQPVRPLHDYERDMLAEYRRQERPS